jgi:acetoin utilization protein AcuB
MKQPVQTVRPHDSILHAREMMSAQRVNQLPVLVNGAIVGIITDRDVRDAFPSVFDSPHGQRVGGRDMDEILVQEVMTENVLTLNPEQPIEEAARLMVQERIGAVPISANGQIVGIITRSDLLRAFIARADRNRA